MFNIKNKIALVTGSSGGLGKILAEGLAKAGARVLLNGRNKDKLEKTYQEFVKKGFNANAFSFDVTNSEDVKKNIKRINNDVGDVDILVNNAGIQIRGQLEDYSESDWDKIININLKGVFIVTKHVVKDMIERKAGKIINICSLQSELGRHTIAPYAASKGGLKMLTRSMAIEWAKHNIQVNGIGPGYFKTEMTKALYTNKEFDGWLCSRTPSNRWGNPEELIGPLLFLASDASSYINGQIVYVDGGLMVTI